MSKEEKKKLYAGQMMLVGFTGDEEIPEDFISFIREYKIGNIILFGENIKNMNQLQRLQSRLNEIVTEATGYPPLIAVDEEGGMVTRLSKDLPFAPGAMAVGRTNNPQNAYLAGFITAREMRLFGLNFDLAPSLDINNNRNNPIIGVRSYGENAAVVSRFGLEMARGLREGGVIPCVKHFPGHGNTDCDSHFVLPVIKSSLEELMNLELVPFKNAIDSDIEAIMTSHILFESLDKDYPCTMSKAVLTDLLRNQLGFKGLIITDCLEMGAIKEVYGSVAGGVKSIEAGADMLCVSHTPSVAKDILDEVLVRFDEERLAASANKIIELKKKIKPLPDLSLNECLDEFRQKYRVLRRECIDKRNDIRVKADNSTMILGCPSYRNTLVFGKPYELSFAGFMGEKLHVRYMEVPLKPSPRESEEMIQKVLSSGCTNIIMGSYNAHLLSEQAEFIKLLEQSLTDHKRKFSLISLRNPYDLDLIDDRNGKIAIYEYSEEMFDVLAEYLGDDNE